MIDVCPEETHDALKLDEKRWSSLKYLGMQSMAFNDEQGDEIQHFEVRNCTCGSTLYRRVVSRDELQAALGGL